MRLDRWIFAVATCWAIGLLTGLTAQAPPPKPRPTATASSSLVRLPDPSPAEIPHIIQTFLAREREVRQFLQHNYTYDETIRVDTFDEQGNTAGTYEQANSLVFSPDGQRQIDCIYCPPITLTTIGITQEDLNDFFNMDMYTLSPAQAPEYVITYLRHVPLDQLHTYLFDVRPRKIVPGHRYFQGRIWVDDRLLEIVKSAGKAVPDEYDRKGNPENTFLPFECWRQPVPGAHLAAPGAIGILNLWFPALTRTDAMLQDTRVKMIIHFKNYKRFSVTHRILPTAPVAPNLRTTP